MEELKTPTLKIEGLDAGTTKVVPDVIRIKTEEQAQSGQMLRPLAEDDPALKKVSLAYDFEKPEFGHPVNLAQTLIRNMRAYGGVGLSAIQIGIPVRVFSIGYGNQNQVFFNPEIIALSATRDKMKEGCISFPFCYAVVERSTHIRLRWQNEKADWQEGDFSGYTARIIQHEYDHLEGITLQEKVGKLTWKLLKEKARGLYKKALKQENRKKAG